ncbi:hypothetical protein B7494_g5426 [Chlorociboria aeruginascens]|nr:hypothetical protein B7494_g5426 [Chlorociboria aeruginascens]
MTTQESIRFPRDHLAPDPGKGKASRKIPSKRGMVDRNDEFIMGTNNSSIVSKRSVERLYFPNEPHFFRYFVKKPLRRSPLINRGYWIRMKAIDSVVHQFLGQRSSKQKIVINLGCASDPLPWQCLTRYANACQDVKFIDVDYVDLMLNKRDVVQRTRELNSMLTNLEISDGDVLLSSDQYLQLGCDLRDLPRLEQALARAIKLSECIILFIAEVSITYMNTEAADALIRWAATLPQARFCLLEQIIPAGQDHPFAQTMMAHFNKLQTPLRPMLNYPTSYAQEQRFRALGWNQASACNLWKLWSSSDFIGPAERQALDRIEPFDEWEELALFGCHYFLLTANNTHFQELSYVGLHNFKESSNLIQSPNFEVNPRAEAFFVAYPKQQGYRRFSAVLRIRGRDQENDLIGNFAGMGLNTRIVGFTTNGSILGRGCSSQNVTGEFLVWSRRLRWVKCTYTSSERPCATYGATFAVFPSDFSQDQPHSNRGLLAGGISEDGLLQKGVWIWELQDCLSKVRPNKSQLLLPYMSVRTFTYIDWQEPKLAFRLCSDSLAGEDKSPPIARFGAVALIHNDRIHIVGGIARDDILDAADEICVFDPKIMATQAIPWTNQNISSPRPLFIGTSVTTTEKSLVIMGGSAVCFSFGTFWNKGCFTIDIRDHLDSGSPNPTTPWFYIHTIDAAVPKLPPSGHSKTPRDQNLVIIPRIRVKDSTEFTHIVKATTPAIIEGADLGPCTKAWTIDYLKESVGAEREVIVHVASTDHMDFTAKNFSYASKKFGEFLDGANSGAKFYLRSLSAEKPSELPADIKKDYPSIADDFRLPPEMEFIAEHAHSTPLRIAGPVTMWLHYDVMANILCQIRGSKRLLLFPPSDVTNFNFAPGASSSSFNVFEKFGGSELENTQPHEALLEPGDILFIPSLWLHTASPTSGLSVAVNIFFRNLQEGYATGRDVYGNRDLAAYEKGRQDLNKIIKLFDGLPADVRAFYMQRLVDELQQKVP